MTDRWFPALAALLFLILGGLLIPLLGVHADEALFTGPWYGGELEQRLMLMPYLGTLKTWLYYPIRLTMQPSVWALRLPPLVTGCLMLFLFFALLRDFFGRTAPAVAGLAILATDPMMILTHAFDWGPVSLHLFLWVAFLRFLQCGKYGLAGLCAGLGLWNKALFIWNLGGFGVAIAVFYWRPLWRIARSRSTVVFVLLFALGAAPLIWYNALTEARTRSVTPNFSWDALKGKPLALEVTLDGRGLFGYMTPEPPSGWKRNPLVIPALVLSLLAMRRAMAAAVLCAFVTWFQMAIGRETGGAVHHIVLLWPIPAFVIACGLSRLPRAGLACIAAAICCGNLVLWSQYHRQLKAEGAMSSGWTDASTPLAAKLREAPGPILVADWGIYEGAMYLLKNRRPLYHLDSELFLEPDPARLQAIESGLRIPTAWFVTRTPGNEQHNGNAAKLAAAATRLGLRLEVVAAIADSHGRPNFEVWRFVAEQAK